MRHIDMDAQASKREDLDRARCVLLTGVKPKRTTRDFKTLSYCIPRPRVLPSSSPYALWLSGPRRYFLAIKVPGRLGSRRRKGGRRAHRLFLVFLFSVLSRSHSAAQDADAVGASLQVSLYPFRGPGPRGRYCWPVRLQPP